MLDGSVGTWEHDGQNGCGNRMVTDALPQCVMYVANLLD